MPSFYKWGNGFPFYNSIQATKIILYGIQPNEFLGRYFGVLFGWVGVNLVAVTLFTLIERKRADRAALKSREEATLKESREAKAPPAWTRCAA